MLQLAMKYPIISPTPYEVRTLPSFVSEYKNFYVRKHAKELIEFLRANLTASYSTLQGGLDASILQNFKHEDRVAAIQIILEKSTRAQYYDGVVTSDPVAFKALINASEWPRYVWNHSYNNMAGFIINTNQFAIYENLTVEEITTVANLLVQFFKKVSPPPTSKGSELLGMMYNMGNTALVIINEKVDSIKKKKKDISLSKFEEAFSFILSSLVESVLPPDRTSYARAQNILSYAQLALKHFPNVAIRIFQESIVPACEAMEIDKSFYGKLAGLTNTFLTNVPEDVKSNEYYEQIVPYLIKQYARDPVANISHVLSVFEAVPNEFKKKVFLGVFPPDVLQKAAASATNDVLSFLKKLETDTRLEMLQILNAEGVLNKGAKEKLAVIQDINDNKIRASLQKGTDSNSSHERLAAIQALVQCTFLSPTPSNTSKTLSFIRKKLKNVGLTMRSEGLEALFQGGGKHYKTTLLHPGVNQAIYEIWFSILDDALQSQDLDAEGESEFIKHPVLKYFAKLSTAAMLRGAKTKDDAMFNFGVELQWRVILFRKGDKRAAHAFFFNFGGFNDDLSQLHNLFLDTTSALHFVDIYMNAYDTRISSKFPEWRDDTSYYNPLINAAKEQWVNIPVLHNLLTKTLADLKKNAPRDADGLYVIDGDHECVRLFSIIIKFHDDWFKVPLLVEYIETMIRSRLALQFIFMWMTKKSEQAARGAKGGRKKRKAMSRDESVRTLLAITPSAIHLRLVKRHLVRWRQDLIDPYILKEKTFRGVFYQPPKEDKESPKKKGARGGRRTEGGGRTERGGRTQGGGRTEGGGTARSGRSVGTAKKKATTKNLDKVQEEKKAEDEVALDIVNGDHREFFCMDLCFELHKLLPRQTTRLAEQWLRQVNNTGRPMPSRVHAIIRYTLMPSTNYADVVATIEKLDELPNVPVAITEALLKGVMYTDEPCAPLPYLFSPKFLQSDRARISVHVAAKCVPYMKEGGISKTVGALLSNQKKNPLKVTTHKAIIRLLMALVSKEHIQIIKKEWANRDLHRDVRITIMQEATVLLKNKKLGDLAWDILDTAVETPNSEVQIAIMACPSVINVPADVFQRKRIKNSLQLLRKIEIPAEHCERFARNVVWKLATTTTDDDVKALALSSLGVWGRYGLSQEAAKLLAPLVTANIEHPLLVTNKKFDKELYNARWAVYINNLLFLCGLKEKYSPSTTGPKELVYDVIQSHVTALKSCTIQTQEMRNLFAANLKILLNLLPANGPINIYTYEEEKKLLAPLKQMDGEFWRFTRNRRVQQLNMEQTVRAQNHTAMKFEELPEVRDLILDLMRTATKSPKRTQNSINSVASLLQAYPDAINWLITLEQDDTILNTIVFACGIRGMKDTGAHVFKTKQDMGAVIAFFQRILAGCPSHNCVPHTLHMNLTDALVSIMSSICTQQTPLNGRMNFPGVYLVRAVMQMFENAATFEAPQMAKSSPPPSASSPWISTIWRRISTFGLNEDPDAVPTGDTEDNAYTTLRLNLGFKVLSQMPDRVVQACPEQICHYLDSLLVTHCFEKPFDTICDVFVKVSKHLQAGGFSVNLFIEAIVDLKLATTVLHGDKPRIEGDPEADYAAPVKKEETEQEDEETSDEDKEEIESEKEDAEEREEEPHVGDDGYEPDAGDDDDRDDEPEVKKEPVKEESSEPLQAPSKFGDRYVNYSMLIALKLVCQEISFIVEFFPCFQKLSYWVISTYITDKQVEYVTLFEQLFAQFENNVVPYMINKPEYTIHDPPFQWTIRYIDSLINDDMLNQRHPYARKLNKVELHNVACTLALRIIARVLEVMRSFVEETGATSAWTQELYDRVERLSRDEDPSIRKKAFKTELYKKELQKTRRVQERREVEEVEADSDHSVDE